MAIEISQGMQIYGYGTTGTSGAINSDVFDMTGFEAITILGFTAATNASAWLKLQMGTASGSLSDATGDVPATKKTLYLEVNRPTQQFMKATFKGATTTGAYRTMMVLLHGARNRPVTQPASTTGLRVYSPGTGTATG